MQMYGDIEDFIDFESYVKDGYSNTIKIRIPENGDNPGDSIFVLVNDEVKQAYDNNEDSTVYAGIIIDRSISYPLEIGEEIEFEMKGTKKPVVSEKWLKAHIK